MTLKGIIKSDGSVETPDGKKFILPIRGTDESGFPEVLIDATSVGGGGIVKRQSIKPFIGMEVEFITYNETEGYNFTIKKLHISDVMNSILNEVDTKLQELEKIHEDTHRYQNTLQGKIYGYREVRDIIKKYCL